VRHDGEVTTGGVECGSRTPSPTEAAMPSPFPGMDPYLEDPAVWPDVHHELISTIRELLNQTIRPKYIARVEERVYMEFEDAPDHTSQRVPDVRIDLPGKSTQTAVRKPRRKRVAIAEPVVFHEDDPVREGRVEILELKSRRVVTVIEVLSPANKVNGALGRASFLEKRTEVMRSRASWVEIDLLRAGVPHPAKRRVPRCEYFVYSSPDDMRPDGKAWPLSVREPLKVVGIPLRAPDPDAPLDLQAALTLAYDRAAYDATVDYTKPPVPPLPPALARWSNKLLKSKKLR
jgi:hypothetical protein